MPVGGLTHSLRKRIADLENSVDTSWQMAFMDTLEKYRPQARKILIEETKKAINSSKEYRYAEFSNALMSVVQHPDIITLHISPDLTKILVRIHMDRYAGTIQEYASAVGEAREKFKVKYAAGKPDASDAAYWKAIYTGQRTSKGGTRKENLSLKDGGQRGRTLYRRTILARFSFIANDRPAPFWLLLEKGNAGTEFGGTPDLAHPAVAPTRFVEKSAKKIASLFNNNFGKKRRETIKRFAQDSIDERQLRESILSVIENNAGKPLVPYHIFEELKIANRKYFLYVTKTRQIGLTLRVRRR